jgi:hypothetical protein
LRSQKGLTLTVDAKKKPSGLDVRELAESISELGVLVPLVVDVGGNILDGNKRAAALTTIGTPVPVVVLGEETVNPVEAYALWWYRKTKGATVQLTASRTTMERVHKVVSYATDNTSSLVVRKLAATALLDIAAGSAVSSCLVSLETAIATFNATDRYPELAQLEPKFASRMADYMDGLPPAQREMELSAFRGTFSDQQKARLAMPVYTHMQDLSRFTEQQFTQQFGAELTAAVESDALTVALQERCLNVALGLEQLATSIKTAMQTNSRKVHA